MVEHVLRPLDVRDERVHRLLDDEPHAHRGRKMEDDVAAMYELVHDGRLEHRVDDEVEVAPFAQVGDVPLRPCREVVEHEDLPACVEEDLGQMRADEAGSAGDEGALSGCFHGHGPILVAGCNGGVSGNRPAAANTLESCARFDPRGLGPWLAVITFAAAGAAAAAGYGLTAPKHYRATAQLLVSPVSASDTTFTGIDVLRDSGGKRTAAASAAALVRGPLVADAVRALLGIRRSRDSLLNALDAHVVDSSDVVAVTVEDTSANGAAQIANAFADTLVNQRTASFQSELAGVVRRYNAQLAGMTNAERAGSSAAELSRRLAVLQSLEGQQDPTLKHAGQATAPTSSVWPDVPKLTGLGAATGAVLGALVALLILAFRRLGGRAVGGYDRGVPDDALEQVVSRLEARLLARESSLAARARDLQEALAKLKAAQAVAAEPPDDSDLVRRERQLEQRVAAVTKRGAEGRTARGRGRDPGQEAGAPGGRAAAGPVEPTPAPVEQAPPPVETPAPAAAAPAPAAEPAANGRYNLLTLEKLVEEKQHEFPERADDWASYLFFLREHAGADGTVPASFDWLIQDTFAELVSSGPAAKVDNPCMEPVWATRWRQGTRVRWPHLRPAGARGGPAAIKRKGVSRDFVRTLY